MKKAILAVAIALAACQSEGEAAEERYRIVSENYGSAADRCAAAQEVAQAYLRDEDAEEYTKWNLAADSECRKYGL